VVSAISSLMLFTDEEVAHADAYSRLSDMARNYMAYMMDLATEDLIEKTIYGAGTGEPLGVLNVPSVAIGQGYRSVSLLPDCAVSHV
jgi:hypothetical protein